MATDLMFTMKAGNMGPQIHADARSKILDRANPRSETLVSLKLLFIGRCGGVERLHLRDVIKRIFGGAIEIVTIAGVADLCARGAKDPDIVFLQGTAARCNATTMLKIKKSCPLASTIYVTTSRRESEPTFANSGATHPARSDPAPLDQVVAAVFDAMQRRICCLKLALGSSMDERSREPSLLESLFLLTPQETRILIAVRQGLPNKLVARHLNITVRTVKAHLTEIFRKTGFAQRAELIVKCSELAATYDGLLKDELSDLKLRRDWASMPFARRVAPRASLSVTPSVSPSHVQHTNQVSTRKSMPTPR